MPGSPAMWWTRRAVWLASHGYRTVEPWTARIMARSSRPIWEGPSWPMETPAWEPQSWMPVPLTAAIRMKSWARVRNAANVVAKGR